MKYSFIITDEKNDFNNMESTCYLIKLEQKNNINEKYNNIDIILPTLNIIKIKFDLIMSYPQLMELIIQQNVFVM